MKRVIAGLALLLTLPLAGCNVNVGGISFDGCRYDRSHTAELPVDGAKAIRVDGWAGRLTMHGTDDAKAVQVSGKACSSSSSVLDEIGLKTERSGDTVIVTVTHPDLVTGSAYMDLSISLPSSLTAKVEKASGETQIDNLAGLDLKKSSGELEVEGIKGDLSVKTSSGEVILSGVTGATTYEGSSGDLTMKGLLGKVTITEKSSGTVKADGLGGDLVMENVSSGDMELKGVQGSVTLERKSSGTVTATAIGGSFTAGDIGSGTLELTQVGGDVTIQEKSSGTVKITGVGKSVRLDDVGSGTLKIADVKGDLVVKKKSSGEFTYDRISGKVDVPNR